MRLFNFSTINCKNCYKCVRSCPVKAIRFENDRAIIDEDKCIACGKCFVVCPKHARNMENDVDAVLKCLGEKRVYACIDSAYLGSFDEPDKFIAALKELGFYAVEEIAVGSHIITKKYVEYIDNNNEQKYVISSSCPTIFLFIKKYHPQLAKYLIPVVTPLTATGRNIKSRDSEAITVYIGPCLSKKYETLPKGDYSDVNYHITFQEIMRILKKRQIDIKNVDGCPPDKAASSYGENYSISGDVWSELRECVEKNNYDILFIKGLDNVKNLFDSMEEGTLERTYIGISACNESCINGPFMPRHSKDIFVRKQKLHKFAEKGWGVNDEPVSWEGIELSCIHESTPVKKSLASEEEIEEILANMNKYSRADELDCGACGYNSCREKAQAVFEGMANVEMCMPYMRAKAENMSDIIFYNARNIIILLDRELNILQFNPAAEKCFQVDANYIVGKHISMLMDDADFLDVLVNKKDMINKKVTLNNYGLTFLRNLRYLKIEREIIVTMQDITEEEERKEELAELKIHTTEIAQNVIEKQMRVAQEIASLLGETTAETKVALNKLKDVVLKEGV